MSARRSHACWFIVLALLVLAFIAVASRFEPDGIAANPARVRVAAPTPPAQDGALAARQAGARPDWWQSVSQQMAVEEYHASVADGGLQAPNRAQNLRTRFGAQGIGVEPRILGGAASAWRFGWETAAIGRPGQMAEPAPPTLHSEAARVTYTRPGFSEWYVNSPAGVEQGFTLDEQPPGDGVLRIAGTLAGGLRAELADGAVDLFDPHGVPVLRYGKLAVLDANGRDVPAWLALEGRTIAIEVNDRDATYPLTVDPLLTVPSWTAEGNQVQSDFGCSVATAGDVNADGYSDVLVGASQYDNGQTDEGKVFLYYGSAAGLSVTPGWTAESDQVSARFGSSVGTAGDVNADHRSDLIIGAWWFTNGQDKEGKAYVYHGSLTGPGATPAWTHEGNQVFAFFGFAVATAGDVNRDGFSDVVIGIPSGENGQAGEGRVEVYHGSPSGLLANPSWTAEGQQVGAQLGVRAGTAGDVNGDGYADLIVGADLYDNGQIDEGRAYVYHGSPAGLLANPSWTAECDQDQGNFGRALGTAGDVNGDGYSDVIVGCPSFDDPTLQEGIVFVYLGSASGLNTEAAWTAEGDHSLAIFGTSVGTAGDVNGDGFADVIIGAPRYDNEQLREGRAYVFYGSEAGLSSSGWITEGDQEDSYFGIAVATAGDVNGDGYSEVIVGAQYHDNGQLDEGRASLYRGGPAGLSATPAWFTNGGQTGAGWGWSVAKAGDVNGDGYSDVIAVAYAYDSGQLDEGKAWAYYGSPTGLASFPAWSAETNQAGAQLNSATGAGDVNGDGYADVILGSTQFDNGQSDEGRAWLYLGSPAGLGVSPVWTRESDQAGAWFGISLGSAGDVNGDGYADVIVGAYAWDNGQSSEGRAWLYPGSPGGLGAASWAVEGEQDGAFLGASVGTAGDVNADGYSDVLVSLPTYDSGQANEGVVWVFHGSAAGLGASPSRVLEVDQADASFGNRVATAGDVNGDGFSDVIVGASGYTNGQQSEGKAFVYHGGASGLSALPAWTTESDQTLAQLDRVATAGDVNGDGYSDVLVGAPFYDNGENNEGQVWLYEGSAIGLGAPVWSTEGGQVGAVYGISLASAGDVNGDGFSDVLVSAADFDWAFTNEGGVWLFLGGSEPGVGGLRASAMNLDRVPKQLRTDGSAPIQVLGTSDSPAGFRLQVLGRVVGGRGRVQLQWEVKPASVPFDGLGLGTGLPVDTGTPGPNGSTVVLSQLVSGLVPATLYHWRLRVLTDSPFFPSSPWLWLPDNAASEADFRTAPGVAAVESATTPVAARLLEAAAPNPFRGETRVQYRVPAAGRARLAVYDVQGRCMREIANAKQVPGQYAATWDGRNAAGVELPSGVYFLRLELAGQVTAQKVVLER